jgi:4-hydroxy-tetrahydrodipicolinate synthase
MASKKTILLKQAKEQVRGIENETLPSFSPDFKKLDEEGIRWDVRQTIKHGFFCTLCVTEAGLTFDEAKRLAEITADEAKGKVMVSASVNFETLEMNVEFLKHLQKVGAHTALLGYPPNYYPKSIDQAYEDYRAMCDVVPDFPIVLYITPKYNFERFHPSGFPLELIERMADIPNTVALKIGISEPGFIFDCFRRVGHKLLVQSPWERWAPLLVTQFGQQWMGAGQYEAFQSPEKPYLVDYFNLLLGKKIDQAMEIFWKLTPVRIMFEKQFVPTLFLGTYHWPQHKYYQWLVGGNGGWTRQPVMKMYQHEMEETKAAMRAIGLKLREPDEEFYAGRVNYAKMKKFLKK